MNLLSKDAFLKSCADTISETGIIRFLNLTEIDAMDYKILAEPFYSARIEKQSAENDKFEKGSLGMSILDYSKYSLIITRPKEVAC